MTSTITAGAVAMIQAAVPATMPDAFGFSTRAVLEVTADAVHDLIGLDVASEVYVGRGRADDLLMHARTTDAYRLRFTGGSVQCEVKYARPFDDDGDVWRDTRRSRNDALQRDLWPDDEDDDEGEELRRGTIKHWSGKSRARMVKALADIDHDSWKEPGLRLAMVTLTLPDDWTAVAPRGADFKAMVERFRRRWVRAGLVWQCVWKLEFQWRGAPHMHLMMRVPDDDWRVRGLTFRQWLSRTWARCVDADNTRCHRCDDATNCDCPSRDTEYARNLAAGTNVDLGFRGTDPKRIAVYFLKHSAKTSDSKEYQHNVPAEWWGDGDGPGRFWGVSGLERTQEVIEVPRWAWEAAKRILRGVHRGNRARIALARRSHAVRGVSEAVRRSTLADLRTFGLRRDRVLTDPLGGGWVLSNDAPMLIYRMARQIASRSPVHVLE